MTVDQTKRTPVIHLCIKIFDSKGNFHTTLPNIVNVQFCADTSACVRRLYQQYLQSTMTQVPTVCKIFFAYACREHLDWLSWGDSILKDKKDLTIQPKSFTDWTSLYRSEGDGEVITINA